MTHLIKPSPSPIVNISTQSPTSPTSPGTGPPALDLWSSILDSVSGSRGVVTKKIIILGNPTSGKTTLLSRLASRTGEATSGDEEVAAGGNGSQAEVLDLGLSYSSFDVGDESDEETVARLGVYQLPSPSPPYPSLLPLALSKASLLDSLAIIVLDWERPWRFLSDLRSWLGILSAVLKSRGVVDGWEGAEAKERLEAHVRHYSEPPAAGIPPTGPSASQVADPDTPLPPGVLTENPGITIVIVCTKADLINILERDKDFKEEQFDYVQQTLRTIALKYGAALFFTSHSRPTSFAKLRAYVLHRLFCQPPAPSSSSSALPAPAPSNSATSRAFPFLSRANVVDRDQVLVPSGWDSWGKIKILRDRYDPDLVGRGWDMDMEKEIERLSGRPSGELEGVDADGRRVTGALRMFDDMVVNLDGDDEPINMATSYVEAQDEQDFLKTHYETLQKDREKDPRAAFAARPNSVSGTANGDTPYGASVVGPMASAGLSLPSVERALERDPDDVTVRLAKLARRESSSGALSLRGPVSPTLQTTGSPPLSGPLSPPLSSTLLSPASSAAGPPAPGAQNEVLANFFQSLLAARGTNGVTRPTGVQSLATGAGGLALSQTGGVRRSSSTSSAASASLSRSGSHLQNGTGGAV